MTITIERYGKLKPGVFWALSLHLSLYIYIYIESVINQDYMEFSGLPVTIRLLDPPLHEFLPEGDLQQIVSELTAETGVNEDEVFSRIEKLSEVNPMLGFRGCRFGDPSYGLLFQRLLKFCSHSNWQLV